MTRRIQFEGEIHEFPDDATTEEISAALDGSGSTKANPVFPLASKVEGSGIGANLKRAGLGILDAASLPTRALAAATTSQKMSDPGAYLLKGPAEAIASKLPEAKPADPFSMLGMYGAPKQGPADAVRFAAQTASDPLMLLGGLGELKKPLSEIGSFMTGKSVSALNAAAEKPEALVQAALRRHGTLEGGGNETGQNLAASLLEKNKALRSNPVVDDALSKAPDIDIRPTLEAFEKAKPPRLGPMGATTPGRAGLADKLDSYARAMRGDLPSPQEIANMDFEGNLSKAQEALADPESKWGVLNDIAKKAQAQSEKATTAAERASRNASVSAGKLGNLKQTQFNPGESVLDPAHPWDILAQERKFKSDLARNTQTALQKAKDASARAQEAFKNSESLGPIATLTGQDAAAAKTVRDQAMREVHVADATNEISKGKTQTEVSRYMLDNYGISGQELTGVLDEARNRVGKYSFEPNFKMPAMDFKRLREALDKDIDHNTSEGQAINEALKGPRSQMRQTLIDAAGGEQSVYGKEMAKWADQLGTMREAMGQVGAKTPTGMNKRAASLLERATDAGGAHAEERQLLNAIEQLTGKDFLKPTVEENLASEFGGGTNTLPTGKPELLSHAKGSVIFGSPKLTVKALQGVNAAKKVQPYTLMSLLAGSLAQQGGN